MGGLTYNLQKTESFAWHFCRLSMGVLGKVGLSSPCIPSPVSKKGEISTGWRRAPSLSKPYRVTINDQGLFCQQPRSLPEDHSRWRYSPKSLQPTT